MAETASVTEDVDIDPKGDVIFVCTEHVKRWDGEEKIVRTRVRASSAVLMALSSVFAAMLGPHFKEGHLLRKNATVEIELPDDAPKALEVLMNVLHLKSSAIPACLEAALFVDVAKLADKYLCVEQIGLAGSVWTRAHEDTKCVDVAGMSMIACFYLKLAEQFTYFSRALVMNSWEAIDLQDCGAFDGIDLERNMGFVRACAILNDYKSQRIEDIRDSIDFVLNDLLCARDDNNDDYSDTECLTSCRVLESSTYELLRHLRLNNLRQGYLQRQTLSTFLEGLKAMPDFPFSDNIKPCSDTCISYKLGRIFKAGTFKDVAEENTPARKLLCLRGYYEREQGEDYYSHCGTECCLHRNYGEAPWGGWP